MTSDPSYGIDYLTKLFQPYGLDNDWCYLSESGCAYGMSRDRLTQLCRESDIWFNLSNINWIPELEDCRRRVLVDTDPVFTQIGAHGIGGPYSRYDLLFTYGKNVHRPGCTMPTGAARWIPTRQPVVLDLWPVEAANSLAPFTTVMNWSALGDRQYNGKFYGQKDREFEPFISFPLAAREAMEVAANVSPSVRKRLTDGGWRVVDPRKFTRDAYKYQEYIRSSRAEFSVAKHGYVVTRCGWFSERSAAYLASGRPVVVQDTGFSDWLETGSGVIPFNTPDEAVAGIEEINRRYDFHCRAAREIAREYFDASEVLPALIQHAMEGSPRQ
jgi:hypothetical protein